MVRCRGYGQMGRGSGRGRVKVGGRVQVRDRGVRPKAGLGTGAGLGAGMRLKVGYLIKSRVRAKLPLASLWMNFPSWIPTLTTTMYRTSSM